MSNISRILLTDIDDTLTSHGRLPAESYAALWQLHEAGVHVVPVTGRPAGFCEMIARFWPVAGVVGENGAFYFYLQKGQMQRWWHPELTPYEKAKDRFNQIWQEVAQRYPRAKMSSDQFARVADLAIDFAEEVNPPLSIAEAEGIKQIFEKHGAVAKVSSIHVNGWFGSFSKLETSLQLLKNLWGLSPEESRRQVYFIGDSPNDEPMWEFFENSFAVANIQKFLPQLQHPPKHIMSLEGAEGFCQFAKLLLDQPQSF
jgi:hypothetical protein